MTDFLRIFALACPLLLFGTVCSGSTYFVGPDGADANRGTEDAPWATIQHAVDTMSPGDAIVVKDGTYKGFRIRRSGTAEAGITLRAENKWGAVVKDLGEKCRSKSVIEINADDDSIERIGHWTIDGFDVDGTGLRDCMLPVVTTHITIKNCKLHDSDWPCIMSGHGDYMVIEGNTTYNSARSHGIYMANSADHGVIRANTSYHNGKCGIHMNGDLSCGGDGVMTDWIVERNIVFDNGLYMGGAAINCDGVRDSIFRNNLLYGNHRTGMTFYAIDASEGSSRNLIANNTIVMADDASWWPVIMGRSKEHPSPTANRFFNNVILTTNLAFGSIAVYAGDVKGFESDYNVVTGRFSVDDGESVIDIAKWREFGYGAHSITARPENIFVDPAGGDYHLRPGSPAIDAGITLVEVTDDLAGNPRPQGGACEIGCYEVPNGPARP